MWMNVTQMIKQDVNTSATTTMVLIAVAVMMGIILIPKITRNA